MSAIALHSRGRRAERELGMRGSLIIATGAVRRSMDDMGLTEVYLRYEDASCASRRRAAGAAL